MITATMTQASGGRTSRKMIDTYQGADPLELIEEWKRILWADNERRLDAGLDVNEQPMKPTLRERGIGGQWRTIRGHRVLVEVDPNPPAGNPLTPYGRSSRMYRLAETRHEVRHVGSYVEYAAQLGWPDFVTTGGDWVPGFHSHPGPKAPYPRRDQTTHPSPTAVRLAGEALHDWLQEIARRA
jgi:hypothetical protein